jgi:polysaccharide pyruvyl transferase WcaK-like protein
VRQVVAGLAERLRSAVQSVDTDVALIASMAAMIEMAATRYALDPGDTWEPGKPLKLLFAGYAGTRNTGADVRVEEMIRQVRHLLGDTHCQLSILTSDPARTAGYFRTVRQLQLPDVFPRFVMDAVHQQHGVIACEGSMFKSKFANALSTLMTGALGVAVAENKVAVAYGGEAGAMDPALEALVRRYARGALLVCRNEESRHVLGRLGLPTHPGTDTAWTFTPHPRDVGERLLADAGWDGRKPVLVLCPINAFWWPVKPDLGKAVAHAAVGAYRTDHYRSLYFHEGGQDAAAKQERYLADMATAVRAFAEEQDVFVAIVGMEALDRSACERLSELVGGQAPVLVSDEHDMYTLVSVLRVASALVSSRYHAIVCSMPGSVPSAGITMDERIPNLMADRGTPELALRVDQPDLADALLLTLRRLHTDSEGLKAGIEATVADNLVRMGQMGQLLVDHLRERHPDFPLRPNLGGSGDPVDHLPPVSSAVRQILQSRR